MTKLDQRPVTRETMTLDPIRRRKPLVVRLEQGGRLLRIKVKGTRTWYTIGFDEIYRAAIRLKAAALRAEKEAARRARRR